MRAGQVRFQHGFPIFQLHSHGQSVARNRRVVHQNVQLAEFLDDLFEAGLHLFGIGHIHLHSECFAASCSDLTHERRKLFFGTSRNGDFRAGLCQRQRRVAPNSLRSPRHQRHFVLQSKHTIRPFGKF